MKNIRNIDEIVLGYIKTSFGLENLVKEKGKGDWSKLPFLMENDEEARQLEKQYSYYKEQFREHTALGNLYTSSEGVIKALSDFLLEEQRAKNDSKNSIACGLEDTRNMIAEVMEDGEEDYRVVAFDNLINLPNYSPDDWFRRKFMIEAIYLTEGTEIPLHLVQRIEETCYSFIYGNFLACIALARATTETALKETYPILFQGAEPTLAEFLKQWHKIKGLKEHMDIKNQVDFIRKIANQVMHGSKNKVVDLMNEFKAKSVVQNMKQVIEFLYK